MEPQGSGADISLCSSAAAGSDCSVSCAAGHTGTGTVFSCPADNTVANLQPAGTAPHCVPIAACAPLLAQGDQFNVSGCALIQPGADCEVKCADGYVGGVATFSCPPMNTDFAGQPAGSFPACAAVVPCGPLPIQDAAGTMYDVADCNTVAAGGSWCVLTAQHFNFTSADSKRSQSELIRWPTESVHCTQQRGMHC